MTPMQLSPNLFYAYDNYEELARIDGEMAVVMKKRSYNLILQLVVTVLILLAQCVHVSLNSVYEIDAGDWMWGYVFAILALAPIFILRGQMISAQVRKKIEEFFEAMKHGNIDLKKLSYPFGPGRDVDDGSAKEE